MELFFCVLLMEVKQLIYMHTFFLSVKLNCSTSYTFIKLNSFFNLNKEIKTQCLLSLLSFCVYCNEVVQPTGLPVSRVKKIPDTKFGVSEQSDQGNHLSFTQYTNAKGKTLHYKRCTSFLNRLFKRMRKKLTTGTSTSPLMSFFCRSTDSQAFSRNLLVKKVSVMHWQVKFPTKTKQLNFCLLRLASKAVIPFKQRWGALNNEPSKKVVSHKYYRYWAKKAFDNCPANASQFYEKMYIMINNCAEIKRTIWDALRRLRKKKKTKPPYLKGKFGEDKLIKDGNKKSTKFYKITHKFGKNLCFLIFALVEYPT
ncbi:hypothetical protein EGR_07647 [Echinococcus granulosus]|uniref:Uncharacterized protein n=1 Tax=Echinococcus granulosus TaxID=6210 RepID=W6UHD3_ECHGR|nr:hypothetical protein EGR_07647 [Echinococcus granulosus]EUB57482.1 hypothetical protein EGR_07647 [Echinococcus granulosus]